MSAQFKFYIDCHKNQLKQMDRISFLSSVCWHVRCNDLVRTVVSVTEGGGIVKRTASSLRAHITWILLVKLVVMIGLKMTFFTSLEQQHQPVDLYFESPAEDSPLRSNHD
ncbi:MAG: hypothetical protein D9N13_03755 [Ketobacter sp. GenoA1]|nr:MAG: hypothetical protein D9N13_03755 [Ketobacter sp. GenoA1]RLT96258.1 MAG: hypothetical protein D9N15_12465 [Ketobacter sp.]